jgi:RNA-binding protein
MMSTVLSEKQKKFLRGMAHGRHALIQVGKEGFSSAVSKEMEGALAAHELVKVRSRVGDRSERNEVFEKLAKASASTLVQQIGNVGVFFRQRKEKPKIILPDD